jgi:hypothetical protein
MAVQFKKTKSVKDGNYLTGPQRRFVVRALAHWNTPTETARMLEAEHGKTMSRQSIAKYDPTCHAGHSLSPDLKKLFHAERERFVKTIEEQPLAHRSVRLEQLKKIYDEARDAGNAKLAIKALSEAGKEMKPLDYVADDDEDEKDD